MANKVKLGYILPRAKAANKRLELISKTHSSHGFPEWKSYFQIGLYE